MLCFFLCYCCNAQSPFFKHYSVREGLPSDEVYECKQDSKGYLWFATDRGVARYDGYQFKVFTTADGLCDNTIFRIEEDEKGGMWFYGYSGGFCYYKDGQFYPHAANKELIEKGISVLSFFTIHNDTIWAATRPDNKLDTPFIKIIPDGRIQFFGSNHLSTVFEDTYYKTPHGFIVPSSKYNPLNKESHSISFLSSSNRWDTILPNMPSDYGIRNNLKLLQMSDGSWICNSKTKNILRFNEDEFIKSYPLNDISCSQFYKDSKGRIWQGYDNKGVKYYEDEDFNKGSSYFLDGLSVSSIEEDHEGGFWFTTLKNGVFYTPSVAILYMGGTAEEKKIGFNAIDGLGDTCFLASSTGDIFSLDLNGKDPKLDLLFSDSIGQGNINDILVLENNRILLGTEIGNSKYYSKVKGIHKGYRIENLLSRDLILSHNGTKISGVHRKLLWSISISNSDEVDLFRSKKMMSYCVEEADGKFWVGSLNGLWSLEDTLLVHHKDENPLLSYRIADIVSMDDGLMIGTVGAGLLLKKENEIIQISKKDGLSGNLCQHIFKENENTYWIASTEGISKLQFLEGTNGAYKINNINMDHGLVSNNIRKLYVGDSLCVAVSRLGLSYFDKNADVKNYKEPPIHITKVQVNNVEIELQTSYNLKHDQNNIKIAYKAFSFQNPRGIDYRYRISEKDSDWTYTKSSSVIFPELSSGDYSFELSAANNDGVWNTHPVKIQFHIAVPYWKSWWFVSLCVVLVLSFLRFNIRLRFKRLKEKMALEQDIVLAQQTALRAQMDPHFIFNILNSIQLLISNNKREVAMSELSNFSSLVRRILKNSGKERIRLEEEIETLTLYLELEKVRLKGGLHYEIILEEGLSAAILDIPPMLVQPLVENAIWHGIMCKADKTGIIKIVFTQDGAYLKCMVEDDGVGIDDHSKHYTNGNGKGLRILKERLSLLVGASKKELFRIKNIKDKDDVLIGVLAEVWIPQDF